MSDNIFPKSKKESKEKLKKEKLVTNLNKYKENKNKSPEKEKLTDLEIQNIKQPQGNTILIESSVKGNLHELFNNIIVFILPLKLKHKFEFIREAQNKYFMNLVELDIDTMSKLEKALKETEFYKLEKISLKLFYKTNQNEIIADEEKLVYSEIFISMNNLNEYNNKEELNQEIINNSEIYTLCSLFGECCLSIDSLNSNHINYICHFQHYKSTTIANEYLKYLCECTTKFHGVKRKAKEFEKNERQSSFIISLKTEIEDIFPQLKLCYEEIYIKSDEFNEFKNSINKIFSIKNNFFVYLNEKLNISAHNVIELFNNNKDIFKKNQILKVDYLYNCEGEFKIMFNNDYNLNEDSSNLEINKNDDNLLSQNDKKDKDDKYKMKNNINNENSKNINENEKNIKDNDNDNNKNNFNNDDDINDNTDFNLDFLDVNTMWEIKIIEGKQMYYNKILDFALEELPLGAKINENIGQINKNDKNENCISNNDEVNDQLVLNEGESNFPIIEKNNEFNDEFFKNEKECDIWNKNHKFKLQSLMEIPARIQVLDSKKDTAYVEGLYDYNIWYDKFLTDRNQAKQVSTALYKCNPNIDTGYTKADKLNENGENYFCLFFAKGCCTLGLNCKFYHRVPTLEECKKINNIKDIFGRTRFANHKIDMNGVGTFSRECKTLYVMNVKAINVSDDKVDSTMVKILYEHFGKWGNVEDINYLKSKACCFIKYSHRCWAEFAKEAMIGQSIVGQEVINIKWTIEESDKKRQKKNEVEKNNKFIDAYSKNKITNIYKTQNKSKYSLESNINKFLL